MVMLRHAVKVGASRAEVYRALTEVHEMGAWHEGLVSGRVSQGETLMLEPRDGLRFVWRTDAITPQALIVQTCVEGPGTSPGRTLTFTLSDASHGRTQVALSDGDWREDDPHLPFCNSHWGAALQRLKAYVEISPLATQTENNNGQ